VGAQYKGVCFPTVEMARADACASVSQFQLTGANLYSAECTTSNFSLTGPMAVCKRTNGGACVNVNQPYPPFQPCSFDSPVRQSSEYFALALGFLAVVFVGRWIYDFFNPKDLPSP
jgi:hypothetical protein